MNPASTDNKSADTSLTSPVNKTVTLNAGLLKPATLQLENIAPGTPSSSPKNRGRPSRSVLRERAAQNCTSISTYLSPRREKKKASDPLDPEDNQTPKKSTMNMITDGDQPPGGAEGEVSLTTLMTKLDQMSNTNDLNFAQLNQKIDDTNGATNARIDKLIESNNAEMSSVRSRLDKVEKRLTSADLPDISEKISRLDHLIARHEKDLNKLDLVIKGLKVTAGSDLIGEIGNFLLKFFGLKDVTSAARMIGKTELICATLIDLETKTHILKTKREKLKTTNIYIELPLTSLEKDSRKKLFALAQQERGRGATVKIYPWGLIVDGKKMRLDQRTDVLVEMTPRTAHPKNAI